MTNAELQRKNAKLYQRLFDGCVKLTGKINTNDYLFDFSFNGTTEALNTISSILIGLHRAKRASKKNLLKRVKAYHKYTVKLIDSIYLRKETK